MERVAFGVEIRSMTAIVFAETPAKAKWIAVRGYWDAYGQNGWPSLKVWREPRFNGNPLKNGKRVPWTKDYVESCQP
jgi:hypothetical protein